MTSDEPLRPLELLRVLRQHRVEFVVIGGFSLAAHGYVRATKDVDVVVEPSDANRRLLWQALQALNAEPLPLADFGAEGMPVRFDENAFDWGGNWLLRTRLGRLDVMQDVAGVSSYDRLRAQAVIPEIPGLDDPPPFAGLDDLIAMKQAAGRPQDLLDISELERARGGS